MDNYLERSFSFLMKSIENLKKESGGQRWYYICEDVTVVFMDFQTATGFNILSRDEFNLFIQRDYDPNQSDIERRFKQAIQQSDFREFMFIVLHALLDPPPPWWHQIQDKYQSSSKDKTSSK